MSDSGFTLEELHPPVTNACPQKVQLRSLLAWDDSAVVRMCSRSSRGQWLHESETIVNVEHSLLFCAPPNTGSLQFRMLAKRMEVSV